MQVYKNIRAQIHSKIRNNLRIMKEGFKVHRIDFCTVNAVFVALFHFCVVL